MMRLGAELSKKNHVFGCTGTGIQGFGSTLSRAEQGACLLKAPEMFCDLLRRALGFAVLLNMVRPGLEDLESQRRKPGRSGKVCANLCTNTGLQ